MEIAKELPGYFNDQGLKSIEEATKNEILYGAFVGGQMAGFATYKVLNDQAIELSWMAAKQDLQNQGVGTQLVEQSLDFKAVIVVEKTRSSWEIKNIEVPVDEVTNLGTFIELEAKGEFESIKKAKEHLFSF